MDRKLNPLILMGLYLFFTLGNSFVLVQDNTYIAYEVQDSYTRTKIMYSDMTGVNLPGISQSTRDGFNTEYPPMPHIVATLFYLIFGVSEDVMAFSLMIFLWILIFSTYWIGRELFNEKIGVIAAVLIGFFPSVIGHSRNFVSDFPQLSLIAFSYMCFFRSRRLGDLKWSIALGISAGLGFLTKLTFPLFLLPMVIIGLTWIKASFMEKTQGRIFVNLIISLIIAAAISIPWYVFNFSDVIAGYIYDLTHYDSNYLSLTLQQRIFEYSFTIPWKYLLGKSFYILAVLGIISIVANLNNRKYKSGSIIVLLWLFLTIIPLSMIGFYTHSTYELPVVLPAALIIGTLFDRIFRAMEFRIWFLKKKFYIMLLSIIFFLIIIYLKLSLTVVTSGFDYHTKMLEIGILQPHRINYSVNLVYTKISDSGMLGQDNGKLRVFVFSRQPPSVAICPYLIGKDISCFNYLECKENKNITEAKPCESFFSGLHLEQSLLNSDIVIVPVNPIGNETVLLDDEEEEKEAIAAEIIERNFKRESCVNSDYESEVLCFFIKK